MFRNICRERTETREVSTWMQVFLHVHEAAIFFFPGFLVWSEEGGIVKIEKPSHRAWNVAIWILTKLFLHKKAFYYSCGLTGHMVHPILMWTIFLYFWICLEYNPMHISCSFKNWITVSPFSLTYFNVGTHSIELLNVTLNRKRVYTLSLFGFITFSQ